jgi:hypothetical protein
MQAAVYFKTTILPGGKVEVTHSELPPGAPVDVIVLLPELPLATRRSALDILAEAPGQQMFKTVEEVDGYLRAERDSWDV